MSQEYCNLGHLPNDSTYYVHANYTGGTDHDGSNMNTALYIWETASHNAPTLPTDEQQLAMSHYYPWPANMPSSWYQQDITSPSDMTSESSSIPYGNMLMHSESESAGISEPWEQDIQANAFPPTTSNPQQELLSNIGSNFASDPAAMQPVLMPSNVGMTPDPLLLELEPILPIQAFERHNIPFTPNTFNRIDAPTLQQTSDPKHLPPQQQQRRLEPSPQINPKPAQQTRPRTISTTSTTTTTTTTTTSSSPTSKPPSPPNQKRRLYCPSCVNSKDYHRGFRGDHELARHYDQKHSPHRYAWICIDLSPTQSLRNCERCKGKHQYGTSYGGAEHFRRRHSGIFGGDWVERLRGKNGRRALSGGRLVEEGWLRKVRVGGQGEVLEEEEVFEEGGWREWGVGGGF